MVLLQNHLVTKNNSVLCDLISMRSPRKYEFLMKVCVSFCLVVFCGLTWGIGKWVAYWMWRGWSYSWGKAGSIPLSLLLALLSCSGAGFSGEGLPLDSQCIGGENICRAVWHDQLRRLKRKSKRYAQMRKGKGIVMYLIKISTGVVIDFHGLR